MINSNNARMDKIYKNGNKRYLVAGIFAMPSVEMVCIDDGTMTKFGDGTLNADGFVQTDEDLTAEVRDEAYKKRENLLEHGRRGVQRRDKPMLRVVTGIENHPSYMEPGAAPIEPDNIYTEQIRREVERLLEATKTNSVRGLAISYLVEDETRQHYTGMHTFITDGQGLININAGLDLLKQYMVDSMRERFGKS